MQSIYAKNTVKGLSICLMSLVSLFIVIAAVRVAIYAGFGGFSEISANIAYAKSIVAIVINLLVLVTSLFGFFSTKSVTKCRIVVFMVLCIVLTVIVAVNVVLLFIYFIGRPSYHGFGVSFGMDVAFNIIYILEAILMIVCAVLCGNYLNCCCSRRSYHFVEPMLAMKDVGENQEILE